MLSIILATVVSMIIGGIWFGPKTLYPVMQSEMDISDEKRDLVMKKFNPPLHFGIVILGELALSIMIYFLLKMADGNLDNRNLDNRNLEIIGIDENIINEKK